MLYKLLYNIIYGGDSLEQIILNDDIRQKMRIKKVFNYEVAEVMNIKPSNFSVMLKTVLTDEKRNKIFKAIDKAHDRKYIKEE